jgi:AraC-like DNA-binding protein
MMRNPHPNFTFERHSPLQFGFELETDRYTERLITYGGEPVLYYQFAMNRHKDLLPVVPDGCIDLLFCCDPTRPSAAIYGSILQGQRIPFQANSDYFGVRLTPKQSIRLRNIPFRETIAKQFPLTDVLSGTSGLPDSLAEQPDFTARIALFERNVLFRLLSEEPAAAIVDYGLKQIYRSGGNLSIDDLAMDTGYSARFLRKKFEETLGISPKMYSRIIRFQNTLHALIRQGSVLTDAAVDKGYYDQAHFVKDFKHFTMHTPSQILELIRKHSAASQPK